VSSETKKLVLVILVFLAAYFVPFGHPRVEGSILEALYMLQAYAREHVLYCLLPAFFIAGAIGTFISQRGVLRYFGPQAPRWLSYSVASVSGTVLAVCSCTVLPLFAGLYRRGAGLGPATAFLYSGPAINVLAIILTARVLGWRLGAARAAGAVIFAVVIGLVMAAMYRTEEKQRAAQEMPEADISLERPLWQTAIFMAILVGVLIFAAWGRPAEPVGFFMAVYRMKWPVVLGLLLVLAVVLARWFRAEERSEWVRSSWDFALLILPLLFTGVLIAGLLMGRPGTKAGLIPEGWIGAAVGGESLAANLTASVLGAFMYFATLTEVPILQGLLGSGMGQGPALALLLAGPALSLPNMLVIRSVLGTRKTISFVALVVTMATAAGMIYGHVVA